MIDWDRVAELQAEIGEDDLAEILSVFFEEIDGAIATYGKDGRSEAETLHFLKGCAANIGLSSVASLCLEGELALRDDPAARPQINNIRRAFSTARLEFGDLA